VRRILILAAILGLLVLASVPLVAVSGSHMSHPLADCGGSVGTHC